jgi:hypothetical protein
MHLIANGALVAMHQSTKVRTIPYITIHYIIVCHDTVTCKPIVGLRNKALLGSRPLNVSQLNTHCVAVGESGVCTVPCQAEPH